MEASEPVKTEPAFEPFTPEWKAWIVRKHLDVLNRLEGLIPGFKAMGNVGEAAAVEMEALVKMLNAEPPQKEKTE